MELLKRPGYLEYHQPLSDTPTERIYNAARFLLENGSVLPANVLYQSESIQGSIYFQYTDSVLHTSAHLDFAQDLQ